tara:strand:- start:1881 stop:2558 length:678 start_codon:yes stop_codon:yes gene_type:complete
MGLQQVGDGKTVTVTAKITDIGKTILLTNPSAFEITKFALSDDEIDYRLWNSNHDNGSAYYGEALENLPLLEPITNNNYEQIYMLTSGVPLSNFRSEYWNIPDGNVTFLEKDGPGHKIHRTITLENGTASQIRVHIPDSRYLTVHGATSEINDKGYTQAYGRKKKNVLHSRTFDMPNSGTLTFESKMNDTGVVQNVTVSIWSLDSLLKEKANITVKVPAYKTLNT